MFWHPCHALPRWALSAHFGWGHGKCTQFLGPPTLGGHRATELACRLPKDGKKPPKSQLWQGNAQVAAKNCQHAKTSWQCATKCMAQCPHMLATAPSMRLPTPATGGQHKGPNMPQAHGAHGGGQDLKRRSGSESNVENFKSALGWQPAHACGCMWLWQMILGAFIGRLVFFCTFLINLINLSSAAMATEKAISRPMAQRQQLAFGCCFGVESAAQSTHFRAHPALGASKLAKWHAGRPKKEISVKCCPAQKNA